MFYTSAHIQECTDRKNRWRGVLKYKDPNTGDWREKKCTFRGVTRKSEALAELGRWRAEMESEALRTGIAFPRTENTVSGAVKKHLDFQYSLKRISITTYQNMVRVNDTIIKPCFGSMVFHEVTREDMQKFVDSLSRRYAPASVRVYFAVVSKTYKDALRRELVERDPTDGIVLPRLSRRQINYLDEGGRSVFLEKVNSDSYYYLPAMIAYYTGMRAGEICALQWRDVKFEQDIVCVRQTAVYREGPGGGDVVISCPKTPKSRRSIPMVSQLKRILELEQASGFHGKDDFVVPHRNPKLLCAGFIKWTTRHEVYGTTGKPISLHGLRHTFATLGVQSGMDVKSLSSLLGHTSAMVTLDTYASDDEVAKRVAMQTLSEFMQAERATG